MYLTMKHLVYCDLDMPIHSEFHHKLSQVFDDNVKLKMEEEMVQENILRVKMITSM